MDDVSTISFEDAGFAYDGESFVLRNIDVRIDAGQFVCIIGGNGSGKSTLAKHVNALLRPSEGHVRVMGVDTLDDTLVSLVRAECGLVFQNPDDQLVASLVENDVAFGPENVGCAESELPARVERALKAVDLAGYERREVATLSGGQRQRLAIAGAIAMDPAILVLDEATSMLDPLGRADVMRTVQALHARGMTVVMITHFMEEAACAQRVIVLDGGSVRMDGAPQEILVREEELGALNLRAPFATRLSRALQAQGLDIRTCITDEELEEELCALRSSR